MNNLKIYHKKLNITKDLIPDVKLRKKKFENIRMILEDTFMIEDILMFFRSMHENNAVNRLMYESSFLLRMKLLLFSKHQQKNEKRIYNNLFSLLFILSMLSFCFFVLLIFIL